MRVTARAPKILVFDSGLGGLTVHAELARARPDADFTYAADDAAFPIGEWPADALAERLARVLDSLIVARTPDIVIIACNTASTLALSHLRATFPKIPIVGTVPAIKPAAAASQSRMISVLATPGTVARDYTRDLIRDFAGDCAVALVGSPRLASLAEARMKGEAVEDAAIAHEIAPCFIERAHRRTDHVVLACTHYPLLIDDLRRLAPWPVEWVDPAPAIARRAGHLLAEAGFARHRANAAIGAAMFTSGVAPNAPLAKALADRHLQFLDWRGPTLSVDGRLRHAAQ